MLIKAKIMDEKTGVKLSSCKWVVNKTNTEITTDETLYTGGTFTR